jgi:hypothetical protein
MLIETIIKPRRDGTVTHEQAGVKWTFMPDVSGRLVCEIEDTAVISRLLATGNFFPSDENDLNAAAALLAQEEDYEDENEVIGNGAPIESNTPPLRGKSLSDILNNLDKSGLHEYAKQNAVKVDGRMSVETLRNTIAESMTNGNA